ncbi:MAG: CPBP family intramembrane glutamic endopeptidase [Streptococcus sp.]
MTLFMSKLMSGIVELLIVSVIPFITWLIWSRKKVGFFDWIGLKKVESQQKRRLLLTILGISLLFLLFSIVVFAWFDSQPNGHSSLFSGKGLGAFPAILAYAILGTALPEEIFFRGFLLKRLQGKLGFLGANLIQSLLFGLIHAFMFIQLTGYLKAMAIMAFISLIAYVFGAINEKKASGSILPSVFIHALANTVVGSASCLLPHLDKTI